MSIYNSTLLATTPLYEGASISLLEALVEHFLWFSEHPGISKQALSDVISMQHHRILPYGNVLPASYEAALKLIEPYLIDSMVFHSCPNDCVVFRGKYAELETCPVCHASRFLIGGKIPAKRFTYLPIGPRLERLFGTASLSEIVQSHASRTGTCMYDVHDSPSWKAAYSSNGQFKGDLRGVGLALCTDGVNPFSSNKVCYSMWPIVLTLLNLPRRIRYSFSSLMLVGIVPGNGAKEPKSLDPYLEIVVDELLAISNRVIYDAYSKAPFQLKVDILLYTLDYPGINKVFGTMGSGSYQGCVWCEIEGKVI